MHRTSLKSMRKFAKQRLGIESVLEIGSRLAPQYRKLFPGIRYVGADVLPGRNVDVVVVAGEPLPFADGEFDAVISGQSLEHDPRFWITLPEMGRVAGRWACVIAPGTSKLHARPDYWRFMHDAQDVWAELLGMELAERWWDENGAPNDCGGIFRKEGA